jgi:hypothetical protein
MSASLLDGGMGAAAVGAALALELYTAMIAAAASSARATMSSHLTSCWRRIDNDILQLVKRCLWGGAQIGCKILD